MTRLFTYWAEPDPAVGMPQAWSNSGDPNGVGQRRHLVAELRRFTHWCRGSSGKTATRLRQRPLQSGQLQRHALRELSECRHWISGAVQRERHWLPICTYNDADRGVDVTVGNFYDEFGSGLVFRTRTELGIDNAMDGFDHPQAHRRRAGQVVYGGKRFDFDNGLVNGRVSSALWTWKPTSTPWSKAGRRNP